MNNAVFFSTAEGNMLIRLLIAHLLADFLFQSGKMVQAKRWLSPYMFWHILVVFFCSFLLSGWFWPSLFIAFSHYLIDGMKITLARKKRLSSVWLFTVDQLLHLLILIATWAVVYQLYAPLERMFLYLKNDYHISLLLLAYFFLGTPVSYFIRFATLSVQKENVPTGQQNAQRETQIVNGGKIIGILERTIILTLVILNQYSAIGFLIACKGLLRYAGSKDDHIRSEYLIIGTLISFAFAMATGIGLRYFLW